MILNSFDSIYDRDPPESQFDHSHQATRRSQQTVTFICELRTILSTNAGINYLNILIFWKTNRKTFQFELLKFHLKFTILEIDTITRISIQIK